MRISMSAFPVNLILWLAISLPLVGQGPINDRLEVTLPYTTWVGSVSLAPGKYTIRQLPTASNPRLLEFSSENGTKMEAAITTFAALDNNNVRESSVVLEQRGGQYYLKNVWIGGKTYGYQLPVEVRDQVAQRSETFTMTASSSPAAPPASPAAPAETVAATQPAVTQPAVAEEKAAAPEQAAAAPAPAPAATPEPAPTPAPAPAAAPEPPVQPSDANAQPPAATPRAEPQAQSPAVATPEQSTPAGGQGEFGAQTPPMPATASFWAEYVLGGLILGFLAFIVFPVRRTHV